MYIDFNCRGCGLCVEKCSFGAISLADFRAVIDVSLCQDCGKCIDICPLGAIKREEIPILTLAKQADYSPSKNVVTDFRPLHHRLIKMIALNCYMTGISQDLVNKKGVAQQRRKYGRRRSNRSLGRRVGCSSGRNRRSR